MVRVKEAVRHALCDNASDILESTSQANDVTSNYKSV